jgi:hypothetical protein
MLCDCADGEFCKRQNDVSSCVWLLYSVNSGVSFPISSEVSMSNNFWSNPTAILTLPPSSECMFHYLHQDAWEPFIQLGGEAIKLTKPVEEPVTGLFLRFLSSLTM